MNRALRKKKSHKAHRVPDVRYSKKTQPEKSDLVILTGARAQTERYIRECSVRPRISVPALVTGNRVDVRNLKVRSRHSQIRLPRHFTRQLWSIHGRKHASAKHRSWPDWKCTKHVPAESNDSLH